MATLALSRAFLDDYADLATTLRAKVKQLTDTFTRLSVAELRQLKGVHLERHTDAADPRARTIRIDDNHRGVVLDAGNDDLYVLMSIGTHDETDRWMANNKFKVNAATGALEVFDVEAIRAARVRAESAQTPRQGGERPLFSHRRDKDFTQLGIEAAMLPALRAFTDDDQLQAILEVLPTGQAEALIQLTGQESVEQIYAHIAGQEAKPGTGPGTGTGTADGDDLVGAMSNPATRAGFHVVAGQEELLEILEKPLAHWRLFLHPSQYNLVHREVYNGPVRVTGGAGTGKTVAAVHRARFLAQQLGDTTGKPILFTTFTRNLAQAIEDELRSLGGPDLLDVIDVVNVDRLSYRIVHAVEGGAPSPASDQQLGNLWQDVVDDQGLDLAPELLKNEWEQVILAQDLRSRSDYFTASRAGRGVPMDRRTRATVWKAVERFTQLLVDRGQRTYLQLAADAAGYVASRPDKPYRHVIVDEAQDLHESQWRLLRAIVAEGPNDMFLVGDSHQRIYDRRSSLSKVGINIRGRSRKLKINYRTTHEILAWSMALLGEASFDDLDHGTDSHDFAGYHSYRHGPKPTSVGFGSRKEQFDGLVKQVGQWVADGVHEESIGIAARTRGSFDTIERALERSGRRVCILPADLPKAEGVRVGTMHRMKGLEFERIAIVEADRDTIPLAHTVTPSAVDPAQAEADLRREACLLYVAATRARDDLWIAWSGKPSPFLGSVGAADR